MKKAILIFLFLLNANCSHQFPKASDPTSSVWERCSESFRTEFISFENDITNKYRKIKTELGDEYIAFLENKSLLNHENLHLYEMCILLCIYCDSTRNEEMREMLIETFMEHDGELFWKPFLFYCWMVNNRNQDRYDLLDSTSLRCERNCWEARPNTLYWTEKGFRNS